MPITPSASSGAKSLDTALNEAASMLLLAWAETRRAVITPEELAEKWVQMRAALEGVLTRI